MCPGGGVLDGRIVRTEGELRAALDPDTSRDDHLYTPAARGQGSQP
jgi:hypothetical protein